MLTASNIKILSEPKATELIGTLLTMTQQRYPSPRFSLRGGGGCTQASERVENKDSILSLVQKSKSPYFVFLNSF